MGGIEGEIEQETRQHGGEQGRPDAPSEGNPYDRREADGAKVREAGECSNEHYGKGKTAGGYDHRCHVADPRPTSNPRRPTRRERVRAYPLPPPPDPRRIGSLNGDIRLR